MKLREILQCTIICMFSCFYREKCLTLLFDGGNANYPKRFGSDIDRKALGTINDMEYHWEDI